MTPFVQNGPWSVRGSWMDWVVSLEGQGSSATHDNNKRDKPAAKCTHGASGGGMALCDRTLLVIMFKIAQL